MITLSKPVHFFLTLSKAQSVLSRRLDACLGGIGFNEFVILYHLSQAKEEKMRRTDLADKVGLTASGVTRLLVPMEKIGLVKRESNEHDARVSLVVLAAGGMRLLEEAIENIESRSRDLVPSSLEKDIPKVSEFLMSLGVVR